MRCAECGLYECCMRAPLGGCPYGEKVDPAEIITTTNTGPWVIDPNKLPPKEQCLNDEQIKMMEAIVFLTAHGWTCITPDGIDVKKLRETAARLAEAVLFDWDNKVELAREVAEMTSIWNIAGAIPGNTKPIRQAAQDLVDAVERYTRQECLRSELMVKKDKLKELINGR